MAGENPSAEIVWIASHSADQARPKASAILGGGRNKVSAYRQIASRARRQACW